MPTIVEARSRVQREMRQLVALVDRESPQTATEVELALWSGVLQLGGALAATMRDQVVLTVSGNSA